MPNKCLHPRRLHPRRPHPRRPHPRAHPSALAFSLAFSLASRLVSRLASRLASRFVSRPASGPAFRLGAGLLAAAACALPLWAWAAPAGIPAFVSTPAAGGATAYTLPVQTLLLMTALTFLPAALLMMTGFTRIIIVLSLLRQALGTQSAPPNQVMVGLALFLTLFVMGPVFDQIYTEAYLPLQENKIQMGEAMDKAVAPLKAFMTRQTRQSDLALFVKMSRSPALQGPEDIPLRILIPAFVTSELKTAFQIGFAIFIPFLIIDMVVASVLMSMGMMMMSPAVISLPFKLMLFVLVDGWQLLLGSLSQSFY